jgi:hypothetical protein
LIFSAEKSNKTADRGAWALWLKRAFYAAMALLLLCLAVMSALRTAHIHQNATHDDIVLLAADSFWPHLLFLPLLGLAAWLLRGRLAKCDPNKLALVMALWVLALGLLWAHAAQLTPRADQRAVALAGAAFAQGDFGRLHETGYPYFQFFPFQLGFTLWLEAGFRVTLPLLRALHVAQADLYPTAVMIFQTCNVLLLCGLCLLLLWWMKLVLPGKRLPQNLLLLFLMGFTPAVLYGTFLYGVLPGLFFSVLAAVFQMQFLRTGKWRWAVLSAGSIALACALKPNSMIMLAALCIQLLLYFRKERRAWLRLLLIPLSVGCVLAAGALPTLLYERRSGAELGAGIPRTAWLAMGLAETSKLGPGWWDPQYSTGVYYQAKGDPAAMAAITRATLQTQFKQLAREPGRALRFFFQKAESQWCEPTYESIWVNAACEHGGDALNTLAQSVYTGKTGLLLQGWMNLCQTALYALAALGAIFQRRKPKASLLALPAAVLGGFLYHQLFEGKSQYIFPYALLLLPLAAYGLWQGIQQVSQKKGVDQA